MDVPEGRQDASGTDLICRLEQHPVMKARMLRLLDMVENAGGDLKRADDAEQRAIDELRAMGQELLQDWAQKRVSDEVTSLMRQDTVVHQVKKTALAQHLR